MSVGVLAMVPDSWGGPWMPRHQILLRLSKHFPVVWVDQVMPWQSHLRRAESRPQLDERDLAQGDGENFSIYFSGKFLGQYYRPRWLAQWVRARRIRQAIRMLKIRGCEKIVLYLWRPEFNYAMEAYDWAMTLYHIDDEYSFKETDEGMSVQERAVIENSDHVIVHSNALMANKGQINSNTSLIPNGVDFYAYAHEQAEPVDLAPIPRPRLGYVGVVKKQLDLALLIALARARPDLSLVIVGPIMKNHAIEAELQSLRAMDNVWFLGNKSPHDLPAYTQHLDIGLLPYRVNDYTNSIYPLKLHEYLATGISVLSTPIETALALSDTIEIADGFEAWSAAITALLASRSESSSESKARRQAVAKAHDWNALTNRVADLIRQKTA